MGHGFDTARLDRIPAFLGAKYVGAGRLPHAATLVSRRGEIAHLSCIGEARPGEALKEDAIFRIASMTKPITSTAFMMLVEEGKVALSDPLVKFCPEFKDTGVFVAGGGNVPFLTRPPVRPILMVDLLRHTAGLTYSFQERTPVDAAYRTRPEREHTFIMGSSMGGLISLYALCEYPDVFGGAGCLSTHWPAVKSAILPYLHDHLPTPGRHKLYFDYGTAGLDAAYEPYQRTVDALMQEHGYTPGYDWLTRQFPGADHNEAAWQARVHIPLTFLMGAGE